MLDCFFVDRAFCPSVCLSVFLSVFLFVFLSFCLSVSLAYLACLACSFWQSTEEVNKLLAAFRELKAMHGWLSTRRKRKEKIPTSQEELRVMAGDPKGTMLMNFM